MRKRIGAGRRATLAGVALAALTFAAPAALAGTWSELDAGDLPATADSPQGVGSLTAISGALTAGTDEDVYRVCVDGGGTFSASTVGTPGSFNDIQLFLFDAAGVGVYANDDFPGTFRAHLPAGHVLTPTAPGVYYLALSSFNNDPLSTAGLIFPSTPFTGVFGPTGPGGALPLSGWGGTSLRSGTYTIALTGASFCTTTIAATVDVRPGTALAPVNTKSKGVVPVAVLTDEALDASTVDAASVCFGDDPADPAQSDCSESHDAGHLEDVDADGDLDLLLHFDTEELGLDAGDAEACLAAVTTDGASLAGCDAVSVR